MDEPTLSRLADVRSLSGGSNFGVLETRVDYIDGNMQEIKIQLKELRTLLLEKKSQWWAVLGSVAGASVVMLTIVGSLASLTLDPIRTDIRDMKATLGQMVPHETFTEKWSEEKERLTRLESRIDDKADKMSIEPLRASLQSKIDELNAKLKRH